MGMLLASLLCFAFTFTTYNFELLLIEPIQIVTPIEILSDEYWIDVSIDEQKIRLYNGGELILNGNVVTGTKDISDTPKGKFYINNKEQDRILTGYRPDGSISYQSHVNFWMPFYGNYGLHDADWREEFGGDIYLTDGSHGCVNTEYEVVKEIYFTVDIGTIVNIH